MKMKSVIRYSTIGVNSRTIDIPTSEPNKVFKKYLKLAQKNVEKCGIIWVQMLLPVSNKMYKYRVLKQATFHLGCKAASIKNVNDYND